LIDKVSSVRASTADAPPPYFTPVLSDCIFQQFVTLKIAGVVEKVGALADKQCSTDPMPTWLFKQHAVDLAPSLTMFLNRTLENGEVPSALKSAYITTILKKAGLNPADTQSYRPISNLSILSKLLERFSQTSFELSHTS